MSEQGDKTKQKMVSQDTGSAIGRRDIIRSLSTIPVLGALRYAVKKQSDYEHASVAAKSTEHASTSKLSDINVALLGAGDEGEVNRGGSVRRTLGDSFRA